MAVVARSPVVGVVAGRAADSALALGVTGGHRHSDPLKPDDPGIFRFYRRIGDEPGQPMAFAAPIDFGPGLSRFVTHEHGQFGFAPPG